MTETQNIGLLVSVMPSIILEVNGILGEKPLLEPSYPHYPSPWVHRLHPYTQLTR